MGRRSADSRRGTQPAVRRDGERRLVPRRRAGRRAQRLRVPSGGGGVSAGARRRAGVRCIRARLADWRRWQVTRSAFASASFSVARTTRSFTRPARPARWRRRQRWDACSSLSPQQMLHAFGSAGTQAAGLWEFLRDAADSKQLHTAQGRRRGPDVRLSRARRLHRRAAHSRRGRRAWPPACRAMPTRRS